MLISFVSTHNMKKIIGNIINTGWKTIDYSIRVLYITHVRSTIPWRSIISTHNFKGINTKFHNVSFDLINR